MFLFWMTEGKPGSAWRNDAVDVGSHASLGVQLSDTGTSTDILRIDKKAGEKGAPLTVTGATNEPVTIAGHITTARDSTAISPPAETTHHPRSASPPSVAESPAMPTRPTNTEAIDRFPEHRNVVTADLGGSNIPSAGPGPPPSARSTRTPPSAMEGAVEAATNSQVTLKAWRDATFEIWMTQTPPPIKPTFSNTRNETLLHTAARQNDIATMQVLVEHGFFVNARDAGGRTALHAAIEAHQKDVIMWLLEHDVDVNAVDNYGRTALSMAVNNACPLAARLFLVHGARFVASPGPEERRNKSHTNESVY